MRRSRSITVAVERLGNVCLGLRGRVSCVVNRLLRKVTYIGHTADAGAFEVLRVQFLNSGLHILGSLELDESDSNQLEYCLRSLAVPTLCHHGRG